jgi:hypothetical protein
MKNVNSKSTYMLLQKMIKITKDMDFWSWNSEMSKVELKLLDFD